MGNPNPSIETSYQKSENVEDVYLMSIQTINRVLLICNVLLTETFN
jgi:hypothetical protein